MAPLILASEVAKHNTPDNVWTVVDGTIYDLTAFLPSYPGGQDIILKYAGRDATTAYNAVHSPSLIKSTLPLSKHIGTLDSTTIPLSWKTPSPSPT